MKHGRKSSKGKKATKAGSDMLQYHSITQLTDALGQLAMLELLLSESFAHTKRASELIASTVRGSS